MGDGSQQGVFLLVEFAVELAVFVFEGVVAELAFGLAWTHALSISYSYLNRFSINWEVRLSLPVLPKWREHSGVSPQMPMGRDELGGLDADIL